MLLKKLQIRKLPSSNDANVAGQSFHSVAGPASPHLVLARHNSLFFTFCSATRFPVYAWKEQCKDIDELVTLGLARVQETSSIIDHGTHLLVNQMKEFTLF